ncbi:MAG: MurR/RpiR family transcriptional regulator [Rhodobacteraceae bacterium]|nr:MurR/RpiR family transcriptional regulator [Paracoccaceae bacterium]
MNNSAPRRLVTHPIPVKDLIHGNATDLTPAERQLAGVLLRDYPMVGLQSITKLAEAAGVSTPTVIRLARKLGFDGFPELQSALRDEAAAQIKQPSGDSAVAQENENLPQGLRNFAKVAFSNLQDTLERLDGRVFDAIAGYLADGSNQIALLGGRITRSNADYFFNHLQIIRPGVTLLSRSSNVWPQYLLDMGSETVLVIFDIRRYEPDLLRFAELAKKRGARILLFTDQWGSPISKFSDEVVNAAVDVPSSWDSTLGINLVVEALIAEVQSRRMNEAQDRIDELESMLKTTKLFRK